MSTDPTGLGNESCVQATAKKYINIEFNRELWCTYKGECLKDNLVLNRDMACILCRYREPLGIPQMLRTRMKERTEILWRNFK